MNEILTPGVQLVLFWSSVVVRVLFWSPHRCIEATLLRERESLDAYSSDVNWVIWVNAFPPGPPDV